MQWRANRRPAAKAEFFESYSCGLLCALRCGQLTPSENQDAKNAHDTSQEQHDLAESLAQLTPAHAASRAQCVDGRKVLREVDQLKQLAEHRDGDHVDRQFT